MVQSVGEVFNMSGMIHRSLLKIDNKDNTQISQDDEKLFKHLGGLEMKLTSIQYMPVSLIYALFWSKWNKNLGWNRGCRHLILLCDPPQLVGGPATKVTCTFVGGYQSCLAALIYPSFPS